MKTSTWMIGSDSGTTEEDEDEWSEEDEDDDWNEDEDNLEDWQEP